MTSLMERLWGRSERPLQPIKLRALSAAIERGCIQSLVDLGGVWAVDGGYTFHALEQHYLERAMLVDEEISDLTRERARRFPQLELVEGRLGDQEVVDRTRAFEAMIFFDVLLHQVAPDWDELFRRYAEHAGYLVVVQPTYVAREETIRLLDLGREGYLNAVPDTPHHHEVWTKMDEYVPERGRAFRDIHDIWQWGITRRDLTRLAEELGFEVVYFENGGPWHDRAAFERQAFVFRRRGWR